MNYRTKSTQITISNETFTGQKEPLRGVLNQLIGIYGNTHFLMQDLNNDELARLLEEWRLKVQP